MYIVNHKIINDINLIQFEAKLMNMIYDNIGIELNEFELNSLKIDLVSEIFNHTNESFPNIWKSIHVIHQKDTNITEIQMDSWLQTKLNQSISDP